MNFKPISAQKYSRLSRTWRARFLFQAIYLTRFLRTNSQQGNQQKESRFPEIAKKGLNAVMEGNKKHEEKHIYMTYLTSGV